MVARCEQSRNSTPLPLVGSLAGYPFPMGTVREHRRAWFLHLLAEAERKHGRRGAKRRLAEKIGTAPSVVSQVASGTRQVGDELARRIEQKHGLQRGQVDGPLDPSTLPTKPASESLARRSTPALARRAGGRPRGCRRRFAAAGKGAGTLGALWPLRRHRRETRPGGYPAIR